MKFRRQNTGNMRCLERWAKIMLLTLLAIMATAENTAFADCIPTLYGTAFQGRNTGGDGLAGFYSIDPDTGAATFIGLTGFERLSGMDVDPSTGIFYAAGEQTGEPSNTRVLITIDRATGVGTLVGTTILNQPIAGMSFNFDINDGKLFAFGGDEGVFIIDKSTGSVTPLIALQDLGLQGNGIAFSPGNVLYHAGSLELNTVNQTTGLLTKVADLIFNPIFIFPKISAMDYAPELGIYFAIVKESFEGEAHLVRVDVTTGIVTEIGPTTDYMDGLTFFCEPTPPAVELLKSGTWQDDGDGIAEAGETINYTFALENTGDFSLTNLNVTDNVGGVSVSGGPIAFLGAGNSDNSTITGSYVITQADLDVGHFFNTATACSTPPAGPTGSVCDTDVEDVSLPPAPSIELVKTGAFQDDGDGVAEVGETITYTFTITNTGNVTLTGVDVTDIGLTSLIGGPIASLAPGAIDTLSFTGSYQITQADIDAGHFSNTAEACGTDPNSNAVCDQGDENVSLPQNPSIELIKTGTLNDDDGKPGVTAGDSISYAFAVDNTGNVTLTSVNVTDTVGGVTIIGSPITSLAPGTGNSVTITGSYQISQADIDTGHFPNTAGVCATPPAGPPGSVCNSDDEDVLLPRESSIELIKTGTLNDDDGKPGVTAGDSVSYTFTITNTGNVTLANVDVIDTIGGVLINGGPITSLVPGASDSGTITASYTTDQADIDAGHFFNTATVCGTPPVGDDACAPDDEDLPLQQRLAIQLIKTGTLNDDDGEPGVTAGDSISYTFTITNKGNVTLTNVDVTDIVGSVTVIGGPIASLAPGAIDTASITGRYQISQSDVDVGHVFNTATACATPPAGPLGSVCDPDDVDVSLVLIFYSGFESL